MLIILLYIIIALVLTYPLIINIFSSMPGIEGDAALFLWNQWWVKDAIVHLENPFFTNLLAYPFGANLAFSSLTFISSLAAMPLLLFLPPVLVFNIIFILSLAIGCFGMYCLLNYLFNNRFASFTGGIMFVFNVYIFQEMQGHFNYTSVYAIPFFVLFLLKIYNDDYKISNSLWAAFFLLLSFYNDLYYTIGLLLFFAVTIVWFLLKDWKLLFSRIKGLALFLFTWLIFAAPLLYSLIKGALSKIYPLANLSQINLYTPDLRSFLVPSKLHTIYGDSFINYYNELGFHSGAVYLSFTLLLLAIIGYFYGKNKKITSSAFWLFGATVFLFFSLGPLLYINGYIFRWDGILFTIPLPYLLFSALPFIKGVLVTPRFIIFVFLCLIVIGGFVLDKIFKRLNNRLILKISISGLIIGLFVFENLSIPIPTINVKIPSFYQQLKQDKNNYTILELPFALSTSFYTLGEVTTSAKLQYYQTVHQKYLLGGYISRVPDSYYKYYSRIVGLDYLVNPLKPLEKKDISSIKQAVASNFKKLNIKYIIIHPEYYNHIQLRNSLFFLNEILNIKPTRIEQMIVYKL